MASSAATWGPRRSIPPGSPKTGTVSRYDAETQDLTWRMPGVAGENFPVRAGYPYIVCLDESAPSQWP